MTNDGISGFELLIVSKDEKIGTSEGDENHNLSTVRFSSPNFYLFTPHYNNHLCFPSLFFLNLLIVSSSSYIFIFFLTTISATILNSLNLIISLHQTYSHSHNHPLHHSLTYRLSSSIPSSLHQLPHGQRLLCPHQQQHLQSVIPHSQAQPSKPSSHPTSLLAMDTLFALTQSQTDSSGVRIVTFRGLDPIDVFD